jgi:import inner membrane translocase subunit TIM22
MVRLESAMSTPVNPPHDPSKQQFAIFQKKAQPEASPPRAPLVSSSTSISHHDGNQKTIYELIMENDRKVAHSYRPEQAMHKQVPIKDTSEYSLETITRRALPYPLAWTPSASPRSLPPDFSWIGNSCGGKALIGTIGGGVMGLLMGVFLGAMSDTTPPVTVIAGKDVPTAPLREQMRVVLRATGQKSLYWSRQFAFITGVFGGSECLVEKYRGKHDVWNSVASGCITGAALQSKAGPQAAALGCGGFAAFSLVIDSVMGTH